MTPNARGLLANIVQALLFAPPNYVRSILGDSSSWHRETNADTELQLAERQYLPESLETAKSILLPSWPGKPRWLPEKARESSLFRESIAYPYPLLPAEDPFSNESWMFINGMCADDKICELNADYLYRLFGRQLTILHNQTHGFVIDLAECAVGKGWLAATEAVRKLFPAFYSELKRPDIERVVLIAHSQGTILAAIFLALLGELLGKKVDGRSREAKVARKLLHADRPSPGKAVRVMQTASGRSGCNLVNIDAVADELQRSLINSVAHWLDWSPDSALGLPPLTRQELAKLEIYSFATCASDMSYLVKGEKPLPYIEHFGNSKDLVARLGMFAPKTGPGSTNIDGQRFTRNGGWGHLLNAHYLQPLQSDWNDPDKVTFQTDLEPLASRLEGYYRQANT